MVTSASFVQIAAVALAACVFVPPLRSQAFGGPIDPPRGLTVVFVDVGQGDGTVLIGPTGKVLVFDAGFDGEGTKAVVPVLKSFGVKTVHDFVASHYHPDHIGGADEVFAQVPTLRVWDRGTPNAPTRSSYYQTYVRAAGSKRRTLRLGQVFDLGSGATAKVICVDGWVLGRSSRAPIDKTYQVENAESVVLLVRYGNFQLWLGGDLTGGGNGTYDMESLVAPAAGDVDVYQVDHHGSNTSTNSTLVSRIDPELCLISAGVRNPWGHPTTRTLNLLNKKTASRAVFGTTPGVGYQGFSATGTLVLTTDGWRYEVRNVRGRRIGFYTDEIQAPRPGPGELVVSEIQRAPNVTLGEFLEVALTAPGPRSLEGLTVSSRGGGFTLAAPYRLLPGERLIFFRHGDPGRNGGLPTGHCWPYASFSLGDTSDTVTLSIGSTVLDRVSYGSGFPGGKGVSAERVNLLSAGTGVNWKAAVTTYGAGGKGTPGAAGPAERTRYPLGAGVEVHGVGLPDGASLHLVAVALSSGGKFDVMALSTGSRPGFTVGSVHVPLNGDSLFYLSLQIPGAAGVVPARGLRGMRVAIPPLPGLRGTQVWFGHFLLDPFGPTPVPAASQAVGFRLP